MLKFCALADDQLPKLKNKKYSEYKIEPDEWKLLDLVREVLQVYLIRWEILILIAFKGTTTRTVHLLLRDGANTLEGNSNFGVYPCQLEYLCEGR